MDRKIVADRIMGYSPFDPASVQVITLAPLHHFFDLCCRLSDGRDNEACHKRRSKSTAVDWSAVGRRVRELRGFDTNQQEFAARVGISQAYLSNVEHGKVEIGGRDLAEDCPGIRQKHGMAAHRGGQALIRIDGGHSTCGRSRYEEFPPAHGLVPITVVRRRAPGMRFYGRGPRLAISGALLILSLGAAS